jgi:hypothetical protein
MVIPYQPVFSIHPFVGDVLLAVLHASSHFVCCEQAAVDVGSRARNSLCILVTLALGSLLAMQGKVSIGVCYRCEIVCLCVGGWGVTQSNQCSQVT